MLRCSPGKSKPSLLLHGHFRSLKQSLFGILFYFNFLSRTEFSTTCFSFFSSRFSNCEQGSGPRGTKSCRIQGIFCPSVLFVRRLIVSADLGALTWWPWPRGLGLKALGLGLGLGQMLCPGGQVFFKFFSSILHFIFVFSSSETFFPSQPTLSVSGCSISPICDHGTPLQSPKTSRDMPKRTKFSFVHVQRG